MRRYLGPVTPISSFEDAAEATAKANSTEYCIAACIYARNLAKAPAWHPRSSPV